METCFFAEGKVEKLSNKCVIWLIILVCILKVRKREKATGENFRKWMYKWYRSKKFAHHSNFFPLGFKPWQFFFPRSNIYNLFTPLLNSFKGLLISKSMKKFEKDCWLLDPKAWCNFSSFGKAAEHIYLLYIPN